MTTLIPHTLWSGWGNQQLPQATATGTERYGDNPQSHSESIVPAAQSPYLLWEQTDWKGAGSRREHRGSQFQTGIMDHRQPNTIHAEASFSLKGASCFWVRTRPRDGARSSVYFCWSSQRMEGGKVNWANDTSWRGFGWKDEMCTQADWNKMEFILRTQRDLINYFYKIYII